VQAQEQAPSSVTHTRPRTQCYLSTLPLSATRAPLSAISLLLAWLWPAGPGGYARGKVPCKAPVPWPAKRPGRRQATGPLHACAGPSRLVPVLRSPAGPFGPETPCLGTIPRTLASWASSCGKRRASNPGTPPQPAPCPVAIHFSMGTTRKCMLSAHRTANERLSAEVE
jgi:hypothetical protein